jgi:hypothetical protein
MASRSVAVGHADRLAELVMRGRAGHRADRLRGPAHGGAFPQLLALDAHQTSPIVSLLPAPPVPAVVLSARRFLAVMAA